MAELDKPFISSDLENIPIDVDMLDFAFVEKCDDWKQLFRILQELKSGKEGHYPELTRTTEERMLRMMPLKEKRRYQALNSSASVLEVAEAAQDLLSWQLNALSVDEKLKTGNNSDAKEVDSSILSRLSKGQLQKVKEAKQVMKYDQLTAFQRTHRAELERRKGNEAFKASEFDAAIRHYTNSIALDCSSDAIWSNRAIAYIKQKLYDLAEVDCTIALSLNGKNVKALARRGFAGLSQGKYKEAAQDYVSALSTDPENAEYAKFLQKALEKYEETEGKPLILNTNTTLPATSAAPALVPVATTQATTRTSSASSRCERRTGTWEHVPTETVTGPIAVSSLADLLLVPAETMTLVHRGTLQTSIEDADGATDTAEEEEEFVQIPIQFEDDDEDEEGEERGENPAKDERETFVRIQICDDDEDEDEEEEDKDDEADKNNQGQQAVPIHPVDQEAGLPVSATPEQKASLLKEFGNSLMLKGQLTKALDVYDRSLYYFFSLLTLNNRAQAKLSLGNFSGAIADSTDVLERDAKNVKALFRRAKALSELKKWSEAIVDLDAILALDSTNAPAQKLKAEATRHITVTAAPAPTSTPIPTSSAGNGNSLPQQQAEALKIAGNQAVQQGDLTRAIRLYSEALDLQSDQTNATSIALLGNRSLVYLQSGLFAEAIVDTEKVLAATYHIASESHRANGVTVEVTAAKKALARSAEAHYQLGTQQRDLALLQRALDDLDRLQQLEPASQINNDDSLRKVITARINDLRAENAPSKAKADVSAGDVLPPLPPTPNKASANPLPPTPPPSSSASTNATPVPKKTPSSSSSAQKLKSNNSSPRGKLVEVEVPSAAAKTLYEFERVWRSLASKDDLRIAYLTLFKTSHYKKIFSKATISDELLTSLFEVLHRRLTGSQEVATMVSEIELTLRVLEGLVHLQAFSFNLSMLPNPSLDTLRSLFAVLRQAAANGGVEDFATRLTTLSSQYDAI